MVIQGPASVYNTWLCVCVSETETDRQTQELEFLKESSPLELVKKL